MSRLRSNSLRHFATALDGFASPFLRGGRELAGDDGCHDERDQGDPVLRVGNREGADRREIEVIQDQGRGDRRHHRDREPRQRGGAEHDQEQRQRDGRRVPNAKKRVDGISRQRRACREPERRSRAIRASDRASRPCYLADVLLMKSL